MGGTGKEPWSATEDMALQHAVARLARARELELAFGRAGLPLPARLRPLGSASQHVLTAPEPHAQEQFDETLLAKAAERAVEAADGLAPALRAALVADVAAVFAMNEQELLLSAGTAARAPLPALDWQRAAAGGFFPARSVQTAEDCKVRWLSHVRPRLASMAAARVAESGPTIVSPAPALSKRKAAAALDEHLSAAVAVLGERSWRAVAAALPSPTLSPLQALAAHRQRLDPTLRAAEAAPLSPADEARILELVAVYGASDWEAVAQFLPAFTPQRLARHYSTVMVPRAAADADAAAGALTRDDRARLALLVRLYGASAWERIAAAHFAGRSAASLEAAWRRDAAEAEAAYGAAGGGLSLADDERVLATVDRGGADEAASLAAEFGCTDEEVLWRYLRLTASRASSDLPPRKRKLPANSRAAAAAAAQTEDNGIDEDDGGVDDSAAVARDGGGGAVSGGDSGLDGCSDDEGGGESGAD